MAAEPEASVHGLEDGWIVRDRSGYLQASDKGLRRGGWFDRDAPAAAPERRNRPTAETELRP